MSNGKNTLFFNESFFPISEKFIYNQYRMLLETGPVSLVGFRIDNQELFEFDPPLLMEQIPSGITDRTKSYLTRRSSEWPDYHFPSSTLEELRSIIQDQQVGCLFVNYGPNAIRFLPLFKEFHGRKVVSFHGYDASQLLNDEHYVKGLKAVSEVVDAMVICTMDMKTRLLAAELDASKIFHVPYSIDASKYQWSNERSAGDLVKFLHVGRFTPKKGVLDLLRAVGGVETDIPFHLDLIGDGEQFEEAVKLAEELGINDRVTFLGSLPHEKVRAHMAQADIFVLNSRVSETGDMEGFPNVIIEAMAQGCCVISTHHAGIPDAIQDQLNGLLVAERDTTGLKDAMLQMIKDPARRMELSARGVEDAKMYTNDAVRNDLNSIVKGD